MLRIIGSVRVWAHSHLPRVALLINFVVSFAQFYSESLVKMAIGARKIDFYSPNYN